ncbi:MAG: 5-formyltetrahydrofolate cyclo-ligase [Boseongicola sp.]|nr:MAG: 5-formyltetrahydrofolate cyclo-ligase [Boseongicola sp.]
MTDKKLLRKEAGKRRKAAFEEVDPIPALDALRLVLAKTDGPVSFYWPIRTEMDPRPVMEELAGERVVCLPVTRGYEALTFRAWVPGTEMEVDSFGVETPKATELVTPEVLVVPLLAFDGHGHRLGYGAGHYDRTLDRLRPNGPVTAIGLAFEAQMAETLPIEPTDQRLDLIVTEDRVRRFIE